MLSGIDILFQVPFLNDPGLHMSPVQLHLNSYLLSSREGLGSGGVEPQVYYSSLMVDDCYSKPNLGKA